ncbi:MAG: acireductone dioxygenase [Rhodanobacteraceae bacterium]
MSRLRIFSENNGDTPLVTHHEYADIAHALNTVGVHFEQWATAQPIEPGASPEQVIAAYRADIDRLMAENGYQAVDVISLTPSHPDRAALRSKFLDEHRHAEDEVRFFVAGAGQFTLHIDDTVYDVLCEAGDLIGVPAGTPHWFDMGPEPYFVAIRLFTNPAGWVADFTGDDIARRFPRFAT